jgi:YggT family protein
MFVIGNFLYAIAVVLSAIISTYKWIVIIAVLLSWVRPDPYNPIVRFLHAVTEPVFRTVRRMLRLPFTGLDFSPFIVILALMFLEYFLVQSIYDFAGKLH